MPTLSIFFGILIRMYAMDNYRHHEPHFHARYAEHEAVIRIRDGTVLAGYLPRNKMKLVQAWLEIRRSEVEGAWSMMVNGEDPNPIEPLR